MAAATGIFVPPQDARRSGITVLSQAGWRVCAALALIVGTAGAVKDATATNETRTLSFHHTHSGEDITITYKREGRYIPEALKKLNWFLRDWRSQEQHTMNPKLFDILWEVYRDVDGRQPINIISSYRSPGTNAMLRRRSSGVARHSQHTLGNAMDFFIPGVALEKIRVAGLRMQRGGVGFYPTSGSPFVHLDTGSVRHWPRMTHDQLVRVFPDGRTVHIPSNGVPLQGYELAQADIARRNELGSDTFRNNSHSFLAGLFGRKTTGDDESEGEAETPAAARAPVVLASAKSTASPASQTGTVPLPRQRPVKVQTFQVAAATSRDIALPAGRPQPVQPTRAGQMARMSDPADVINARGFWDEGVSSGRAAIMAAGAGAGDPSSTASVSGDPLDPQALGRAKLAMAYAAADRPLGAGTQSGPTAIKASAIRSAPAGAKATAPASAGEPIRSQVTAAWNPAKSVANDPWLRAMILAPSSRSHLSTVQSGLGDLTTLASLMHRPRAAVYVAFAEIAHPGLTFTHFAGPAVAFVPTVSFGLQTASIR